MFGAQQPVRPVFGQAGAPSTTPSLFGTAAPTTGSTTGLFGTSTAAPGQFGGSTLFGAQQPAQSATTAPGGLFGATAVGAPAGSTFGGTGIFGQPKTTSGFTFGSTAPSTFSFTNPVSTGTSGGFSFTQPAGVASGAWAAPGTAAQATNLPQSVAAQTEQLAKIAVAISTLALYGDERDAILRDLNQLQTFLGSGKGYYTAGAPPVDFVPDNPFCRFKTVGYSRLMGYKNEDGCVGLTINKRAEDVESNRQLFLDGLFKIFGSRPTVSSNIEGIRPLPEKKCEVVIYVTEVQANGVKRRIPANELANFLCGATIKPQLEQQLAVEAISLKTDLGGQSLSEYLLSPPPGLDPLLWAQAVKSNPDPSSMIPVQILGFKQLRHRHQLQLQHASWQQQMIEALTDRHIPGIEANLNTTESRIAQLRIRQKHLSHRLLKVITMQHQLARQGYALDSKEESLQSRMEALSAHLNAPLHCRGRLTELLTTVRCQPDLILQSKVNDRRLANVTALEPDTEDELKSFLKRFQDNLEKLNSIVNEDDRDLSIIKEHLHGVNIPRK